MAVTRSSVRTAMRRSITRRASVWVGSQLCSLHVCVCFFFFSSRRRHTRCSRDWSSDVCSSDLATHAGGSLYEYCYIPDFATAVRHLRRYDGDIWRWWRDFGSRVSFTREEDMSLLSVLGVAACFSANEDGTVDLPFDPATGALRAAAWQRWLDWDPVRMVPSHADALRGRRAIWIDAGTRDEYHLDLGAEAFRAELRDIGVADDRVHFELFDAGHMGIDYRYPMSLGWLCGQMTPDN